MVMVVKKQEMKTRSTKIDESRPRVVVATLPTRTRASSFLNTPGLRKDIPGPFCERVSLTPSIVHNLVQLSTWSPNILSLTCTYTQFQTTLHAKTSTTSSSVRLTITMSTTTTPNDSPAPIQPLHNPKQAAHVVVPQAPLGNSTLR